MQPQTQTHALKSRMQHHLETGKGTETPGQKPKEIILLENAVYYFIDYVLIILEQEIFRLVVIADGHKVIDKSYDTIRGAKVAFFRSFKHRARGEFSKPRWSAVFPPEKEWLEDRLKGIPFNYRRNPDRPRPILVPAEP